MENEFLSKVEDNAVVSVWSEKLQSEKGDSLAEGYVSELQDFTRINVAQNELQELRDVWASWDEGTKQLFYQSYGDISYLLDIMVDKHLFRVMVQFWNSAYKCFTFGEVDLVPTMEEYTALLSYSPLKEEAAIQRREDITEEKWMEILQNLKKGDIEWRAYWMVPDEIMYRCGNFDWVPLLGIWGATGYTPLLTLRQYKSRQFVPTTHGLAQCEFSFKGAHYKKKVRELSDT
ncbi:hypothetical protein CXB51_009601 [Gossypium anomalum]|uniref:DUF7745 domain-containing protein n=1 Tax=Gossypium anomalum TaxID=47600 RepID=A0A8J6D1B6_9ROSI|nr:hypothetical protein CXB51_009601 [Gossypium anomalum]